MAPTITCLPSARALATSPANNAYVPGFAAALMLKDLKLSQDASQAAGATTPLGAHAAAIYAAFEADGFGGKDFSGIVEYLRAGKGA